MTTEGTQTATGAPHSVTWSGLLHLFVVYIVWGSTYLAIRIAVQDGSGFPPFTLGATRAILSGVLLLAWTALLGQRIRPSGKDLVVLLASGVMLWTVGNGLLIWAEQRIPSALAALVVSSTPIWAAIVESLTDRRTPSVLLVISLAVGFCGTGLLSLPILSTGSLADALSILALLLASLGWSCGSILQNRRPVQVGARNSAAFQQLFGGLGFVLLVLAMREPFPRPTIEAWWAWGYLVVFGSILGFTSFVKALRLLPTGIVFTYAYVNPLIAVVLGWIVLSEPITTWTVAGAALILLGVFGVFRDRARRHDVRRDSAPARKG